MKEALKLALEALEYAAEQVFCQNNDDTIALAITAIKEALAQPAQEPDELTIAYMSGLYDGKKKRPWVGLTDEDLVFWTGELGQGELGKGVIRAVSDHLKEKNT